MTKTRASQRARRRFRRLLRPRLETLERRLLLTSAWQNPYLRLDVSNDNTTAPGDVLNIVNELNNPQFHVQGVGVLPDPPPDPIPFFFDTTGDGIVAALDALNAINGINGVETPPLIDASLEVDTAPAGTVNEDGITANAAIIGSVKDDFAVVASLQVQIDDRPLVDVPLDNRGRFSVDPEFLSDGSQDGLHSLTFTAIDGRSSAQVESTVNFFLDTTAPFEPLISLGDANIDATQTPVRLRGTTEEFSQVRLQSAAVSAETDELGSFVISDVDLQEGENDLSFELEDIAGNLSTVVTTLVVNEPPSLEAALANDTSRNNETNSDGITADPTIAGVVTDASAIDTFQAAFAGDSATVVDVTAALQEDGTFTLSPADLQTINEGDLPDGRHTLMLTATDIHGNSSETLSLSFTLDTLAPTLELTSLIAGETLSGDERISGTSDGTGSFTEVFYQFGEFAPQRVGVSSIDNSFSTPIEFRGTPDGIHTVSVIAQDQAGNMNRVEVADIEVALDLPLMLSSVRPADGSTSVGVTAKVRASFSKSVDPTTVSSDSFFASVNGEKLPAKLVPSGDGLFATLFFDEPLPGSSVVDVTVAGDTLLSAIDGEPLDADGDGVAGGTFRYTFSTVSTTPVPGTTLRGRIVSTGPDGSIGTADDLAAGPDGELGTDDDIALLPIEGATIKILGMSEEVRTDADGFFELSEVPTGRAKVEVDGRTASNAPAEFYYPEMVMDVPMLPGAANTIMGMEKFFLPPLPQAILQPINNSIGLTVSGNAINAPHLTPEQQAQLSITIPPGSLLDAFGQPVDNTMVGFSTVDAQIIEDMLPAGLVGVPFGLTVQVMGVAYFATPALMTFPNLEELSVGTSVNFISFDHDTGLLVNEGPATVTSDGTSLATDPGVGLVHPGWSVNQRTGTRLTTDEGVADRRDNSQQQATDTTDPTQQPEAEEDDPDPVPVFVEVSNPEDPLEDKFFLSGSQPVNWVFRNDAPADAGAYTLSITSDVSVNSIQFLEPEVIFSDPAFLLEITNGLPQAEQVVDPGKPVSLRVRPSLPPNILIVDLNGLDGVFSARTVKVSAFDSNNKSLKDEQVTLMRFTSLAFEDFPNLQTPLIDSRGSLRPQRDTIVFEPTLAGGNVTRKKFIQLDIGEDTPRPEFKIEGFEKDSFQVRDLGDRLEISFRPTVAGRFGGTRLTITPAEGRQQRIDLEGLGVARPDVNLNLRGPLLNSLESILEGVSGQAVLGPLMERAIASGAERDRVLDLVEENVRDILTSAIGLNFSLAVDGLSPDNDFKVRWNETRESVLAASEPVGSFPAVDNENAVRSFVLEPLSLSLGVLPATPTPDLIQTVPTAALGFSAALNTIALADVSVAGEELLLGVDELDAREETEFESVEAIQQALANVLAATSVQAIAKSWGVPDAGQLVQSLTTGEVFIRNAMGEKLGVDTNEIMISGREADLFPDGPLKFNEELTLPILKMALGLDWTQAEALDALVNYQIAAVQNSEGFSPLSYFAFQRRGRDESPQASNPLPGNDHAPDAGEVAADGDGDESGESVVSVVNTAGAEITVNDVSVQIPPDGRPSQFHTIRLVVDGEEVDTPAVIPSGAQFGARVKFDPQQPGRQNGQVILIIDEFDDLFFDVFGFGVDPGPDFKFVGQTNNLGGFVVSPDSPDDTLPFAIRNEGLADGDLLEFSFQENSLAELQTGESEALRKLQTSSTVVDATGQFGLTGLPDGFSRSNPITLFPQEQVDLGLAFNANQFGLIRTFLRVETTDLPDELFIEQTFVATGMTDNFLDTLDYGNDFVAVQLPQVEGAPVLRTRSDANGNWEFALPPDETYVLSIFDPVSGLISRSVNVTGASGEASLITVPVFAASSVADLDGDGLPGDIEFTIGTSDDDIDSNDDGIDDFIAIQQNLDPLAGVSFPVGVVASLNLDGEANEVVVEGEIGDPQRQTAFLATGDAGLAVVDVTQFDSPMILSQLDLPGDNIDISVDNVRRLAVLAATTTGLHIVDWTNPRAPQLRTTVELAEGANGVEVFDGRAYVASGTNLVVVDLNTGTIVETLEIPGGEIVDVARESAMLYTMDADNRIQIVDAAGFEVAARGSTVLAFGGSKIFAGGGIVSAVSNVGFGGFSTVDVSDPDNPQLISGPDNAGVSGLAGTDVVATGSGLGLLVGTPVDQAQLDVVSTADPNVTDALITSLPLPAAPRDVFHAGGFAFVANGTAGLQVVNFQAFDVVSRPPQAMVSTVLDDQPQIPGVQVISGTTIPLTIEVRDDVQVRRVDLLVDGETVDSDVSFPFEFRLLGLDAVDNLLSVQIRATDTGGNQTISAPLEVQLFNDTIGPEVIALLPTDGEIVNEGTQLIEVRFDEPVGRPLAEGAFQVVDDTSAAVNIERFDFRADDRAVQLLVEPLATGNYTVTVDTSLVTDRAGNVGTATAEASFSVLNADVFWIGENGSFDDPSNWSTGSVPGEGDDVFIGVPGDVTVTVSRGVTVNSIFATEHVIVEGNPTRQTRLEVSQPTTFGAGLTVQGNSIVAVPTTMTLRGTSLWIDGTLDGLTTGEFINEGSLTVISQGFKRLGGGTLTNNETLTFENTARVNLLPGTVNNNGLLEMRGGRFEPGSSGSFNVLNNSGVIRKTGSDLAQLNLFVVNTGEVQVLEGTLEFGGGNLGQAMNMASDVDFQISEGATLAYAGGTHHFIGSNTFSGSGTVMQSRVGPRLEASSGSTVAFDLQGLGRFESIRLQGEGDFINEGVTLWDATDMEGTGQFVNNGTLNIQGNRRRLSRALVNNGRIVQDTGNQPIQMPNGTITNNPNATFEVRAGHLDGGQFTNFGSATKTTDSSVQWNNEFTVDGGTVDVEEGTLQIARSSTADVNYNDALVEVSAGANLEFLSRATHSFRGTSRITGEGSLNTQLATLHIPSIEEITFDVAATQLDGVTLLVEGSFVNQSVLTYLGLTAGEIVVSGTFANQGEFRWTGRRQISDGGEGTGLFHNQPGGVVNISGTFQQLNSVDLLNEGTIVHAEGQLQLANGVSIENAAGGTYEIETGDFRTFAGENAFLNQGRLVKTGDENAQLSLPFVDDGGVIDVQAGVLEVPAGLELTSGVLTGTATLSGDVINSGGEVRPGDSPGILTIDGTYTQATEGTLSLEIGGLDAPDFDQLAVAGTASLGGTLNITLINDFEPAMDNSFAVVTFASSEGAFDSVLGQTLPNNLEINVRLAATEVVLDVMAPLRAAMAAGHGDDFLLTPANVAPLVDEAVSRWQKIGHDIAAADFSVEIVSLTGTTLGLSGRSTILLDADGAGYGWFIDPTPDDDEEFSDPSSPAADAFDLLTVLMHEIGHLLGADDIERHGRHTDVMQATLPLGTRRAPAIDAVLAKW